MSVGDEGDRILNIKAKKTEREWSYSVQAFVEKATHLWFTWISWLLATGALEYVAHRTHSILLSVLEFMCYTLLSFYFFYFFLSIRIEPYYTRMVEEPHRLKKLLYVTPYIGLVAVVVFGSRHLISHVITLLSSAR